LIYISSSSLFIILFVTNQSQIYSFILDSQLRNRDGYRDPTLRKSQNQFSEHKSKKFSDFFVQENEEVHFGAQLSNLQH